MRGRSLSRRLPPLVALVGALLAMLMLAPLALATTGSPVTWAPADSTYGVASTPFVAVPSPAPPGTGATALTPGAVYGSGFWDATSAVYAMGFINSIPTGIGLPTMAQTELAGGPLPAGTPLTLAFDKTPGQRVNFVAILGDPDSLISIEPADPTSLTAASRFTVRATITDPVQSLSGDVGAAFGLIVDCSADAARDYQGSIFVTNMHWLDIDPPAVTAASMAGLTAHGSSGSVATFDGIFTPAFLASMGIADPNQVQGYVDVTAVAGWTNATFTVLGAGDGSLWPDDAWKYRITNGTWCTHTIMFGQLAAPAKASVVSPKGLISAVRPTFKWKKVSLAARYEVRVYKGSKLLLKKTGATALQWKASKALPRGVYLTWKVRGSNAAGTAAWSTSARFKIR